MRARLEFSRIERGYMVTVTAVLTPMVGPPLTYVIGRLRGHDVSGKGCIGRSMEWHVLMPIVSERFGWRRGAWFHSLGAAKKAVRAWWRERKELHIPDRSLRVVLRNLQEARIELDRA